MWHRFSYVQQYCQLCMKHHSKFYDPQPFVRFLLFSSDLKTLFLDAQKVLERIITSTLRLAVYPFVLNTLLPILK